MFRDRKRKANQVIAKLYSDGGKHQKIKVVQMSTLRTAGIEDINKELPEPDEQALSQRDFVDYDDMPFRCADYDKFVENVLNSDDSDEEKAKKIAWKYEVVFGVPVPVGLPDIVEMSEGVKKREKMRESISRARSTIYELAFCNQWDLFFTGTLDPEKQDRSDLEQFRKDFTQFVRDKRKKYGTDIKFLIVPELHADKENWHVHGLIAGLPDSALRQFRLGDTMGKYIVKKVRNGDTVYSWNDYANRFGFCDLEPIRNHDAVAGYISKYISKALDRGVKELGKHLYYCSRGLNRAQEIAKGTPDNVALSVYLGAPTFMGDYCNVWWLPYSAELVAQLAGDEIIVTPIAENSKRI